MQNFFDQLKLILADDITYFSSTYPSNVYFELNYRGNKVEMEYCGRLRGSPGPELIVTIDLGSDLELEILPKSFFDRMFDIQAAVPFFDRVKKFKIKTPLSEDELTVRTNREDLARGLLASPEVARIINDHGIEFFQIENGELKVFLSDLSTEKLDELRNNPALINKYLDMAVDLAQRIKI